MELRTFPAPPEVSVVIPVFNEEGHIRRLIEKVRDVLCTETLSWELLIVDDGSTDQTWAEMSAAACRDGRIRCIGLSRNFGHQHALLAGFTASAGRAVISMDGDMQHPPDIIPLLLERWRQGSKIVTTRRHYGESAGAIKKITSRYFYQMFSNLAEIRLEEGSSDFRLLDREVLEIILSFRDANLFLRGAVCWVGYPSSVVDFQAAARASGRSKYGLIRMLRFGWSAVLAFSTKPLRMGIWIGVLTSGLAFLEVLYVLVQHYRGVTVTGWTSTIALMSFLFGVLFIVVGFIGAYVASIHEMLQNRPRFIINKSRDSASGLSEPAPPSRMVE